MHFTGSFYHNAALFIAERFGTEIMNLRYFFSQAKWPWDARFANCLQFIHVPLANKLLFEIKKNTFIAVAAAHRSQPPSIQSLSRSSRAPHFDQVCIASSAHNKARVHTINDAISYMVESSIASSISNITHSLVTQCSDDLRPTKTYASNLFPVPSRVLGPL